MYCVFSLSSIQSMLGLDTDMLHCLEYVSASQVNLFMITVLVAQQLLLYTSKWFATSLLDATESHTLAL